MFRGFPGGWMVKKSACNVGELGSIPRWGRFTEEGRGYPLQYSWASLVAQLVKNPPAMWENWVRCLGWEVPPEKGLSQERDTDEISQGECIGQSP